MCNVLIVFWFSDSEKRSRIASNSNVKFAKEYLDGLYIPVSMILRNADSIALKIKKSDD